MHGTRSLELITSIHSFWVVEPCSVVVGYWHFGGPCCQWMQHGPLKYWYTITTLHGASTQKIMNSAIITMQTSNLDHLKLTYTLSLAIDRHHMNHCAARLLCTIHIAATPLERKYWHNKVKEQESF
jgi:hypothetical protein